VTRSTKITLSALLLSTAIVAAAVVGRNHPPVPHILIEPSAIDFGEIENGEDLEARFKIKNTGSAALEVATPTPSCGCMVVSRSTPSGPLPVDNLTVPPGGEIELVSGMVVRDFQGLRENNVLFRSNDPDQPVAELKFRVVLGGRIIAYPTSLNFGQLQLGSVAVQKIRLSNTGRKQPFQLSTIDSSLPDQLTIRSTSRKTLSPSSELAVGGTAEFEAVLSAAKIGRAQGIIRVFDVGGKSPTLTIPVAAIIVPTYQFRPAQLILPRNSSAGNLYYAETVCSRPDGRPFQLRAGRSLQGCRIQIRDAATAAEKVLRIDVDPKSVVEGHHVVLTYAKSDEGSETLLPLELQIAGKMP
jgi:hypothetical protein